MSRKYYWAALTCAGIALVAGCRGGGRSETRGGAAPAESSPPLNGSQVADIQAALAQTLDARGEGEQALRYYQEAVRKDPTKAEWWGRLAVLADKQGMFAESEEAHRRAVALQPANPDLHCNLGYSLHIQQRWEEAGAALQRALELNPDHKKASNNLGLVLARSGRGSAALESFQRAGCSKADAHANLAFALTLNGELDNARRQYSIALQHEPGCEAAQKGLENLSALAARLTPGDGEGGEKRTDVLPSPTPPVVPVTHTAVAADPTQVAPDSKKPGAAPTAAGSAVGTPTAVVPVESSPVTLPLPPPAVSR